MHDQRFWKYTRNKDFPFEGEKVGIQNGFATKFHSQNWIFVQKEPLSRIQFEVFFFFFCFSVGVHVYTL